MVFKEVSLILNLLKKLSIPQILLTDHPLSDKLERLSLNHYFNMVFSSFEHVKYWKPHQENWIFLNKKIKLDPKRTLAIGDRKDTDQLLFKKCIFMHVYQNKKGC